MWDNVCDVVGCARKLLLIKLLQKVLALWARHRYDISTSEEYCPDYVKIGKYVLCLNLRLCLSRKFQIKFMILLCSLFWFDSAIFVLIWIHAITFWLRNRNTVRRAYVDDKDKVYSCLCLSFLFAARKIIENLWRYHEKILLNIYSSLLIFQQ